METNTEPKPCYILLDIDGVLNKHLRHDNGYCGIDRGCVRHFNRILRAVPLAKICIISAWRYNVHGKAMTVKGMEAMLLPHGVDCYGRIVGITESDEQICGHIRSREWLQEHGAHIRRTQVWRWLFGTDPFFADEVARLGDRQWCVIDDLDLGFLPEYSWRQVVTQGDVGLTVEDADRAIAILRGDRSQ
jgi:hypothetical protein